jgi:hypothetical protein
MPPAKGQAMKKTMLRVALLSCATLAVGPAMASHSWGSYHWGRTANPLNLTIERQITSQWVSAYNGAEADWDQSTVLNLTPKDTNAGVNAKKCTAITGKVLVCNAAYGQRGWLGIASIWASGNHITKATTKLNDSYHNYPPYNTPAWRNFVTCQEIGHDFGLDHQDEDFDNSNLGTCMDYTSNPESNQSPNSHDYQQLSTIYAHLDSVDTSATQQTNFGMRVPGQAPVAPPGLNEEAGDSPAEWGRAIGSDRQGRSNLYVQDLGGGRRKFTHVLWAIGEGPKN